ncbi:cyclic nucleotide-binding domain protein, partial (macronuclear) [Tetrahymena thermophila SB210]
ETINVLEKPLEKRSKNELSVLINLTKDIPFFKEYRDKGQKEIHEQCVAHMQYQFVQDKQYVFEIGTTGDKFYLILNGKCGIYIKIGDPPTLTCVKVIEGGAGFGEVALLKNQPRLASILCQSDCHLATLDKQSFIKILKQAEEDKLTKEMEFFAKMPMFVKWASHSLKLLYLNTYRVKCKKGEYLFKEGQSSNAAYIVCQGEFTATKKFTQEIDDDEECLQKQKHETLKFKNLQKDNSPTKDQRIVFWQPYELFGEEEFIDEIQDLEQQEKQRRERIKNEQAQEEQMQIEKQKKLQKSLEQKKKEQEVKKLQTGGNNNKSNEQNKAKICSNITVQTTEKIKLQKRNLSQAKVQIQNDKNEEDEEQSESDDENIQEQAQKKQIHKNKEYLRKYSVQCTSVVGEVCMIKKYDFIHRVLRDTMSRQIIQERNKIKNGWFYNKVDGVNKLMSYSDYCTFYYTDLKLRNRIQGALAEEDQELQEFVNVVKEAFQQNETLVRYQRKRNTKSEDIPHYSSKEIKKYDIPIHAFGNKSQNMKRMNVLEQDALEEKAKKGIRKPPDIMDELVKKFHQNLKQNYYARFKKDSYEQFSNMVQHIEHQGLKSMIKQDDRVNPILKREKSLSEGLKKQSSALIQIAAAKKFCKVLLKIRDRNQIQKKNNDQKIDIENQEKEKNSQNQDQQKFNSNQQLHESQNEQQLYNFNNTNTARHMNSSINQTQTFDSPKRGDSENQETKITDSPKTPETLQYQRRKFFSVDAYQNKSEQQVEETLQEKRRFRNLAKINTQIEQISKLNNQSMDNFQQILKTSEDRGESPLKNPQYFITKNMPHKPRSKSREPYKFELEKLKIFQITQPDINKSLSSLQLDNKNSSLSTIDKSQIIHSSSSMPNKIASQRQKLKLIKRINYIGSQNESDNSIQNLINKFGGENILNQKQLNQQQQHAKQISQLRSAKSYQSINNNIIFQSRQNYAFASQNGQIQVNSKQFNSSNNNNNVQKNVSTNTEMNLVSDDQRFNSVHQGQDSSQSPLKIQQIINSILTQQNQQIQK